MKVLVTGGAGFLGSHICEYYRKQGDEVVSIDNLTKYELMRTGYNVEGTRLHNWNYLKELGVELWKGDIAKKRVWLPFTESLNYIAKDCDFICHTAAQPSMTISIENPVLDFENNVLGTLNVLEIARKYDIPIVNCSSIHIYGTHINDEIWESDVRFKRNPDDIKEDYSIMHGLLTPLHASKRAAEIYTQTYVDTYGLKAASFRLTGMYGERQFGGEDHGWVMNFIVRSLLEIPIKIFGTNKQCRDILYATDAVKAFDAFYKHQKSGIYNIGGGLDNLISLRECLDLISEITEIKQKVVLEKQRQGDLWYFCSNTTKAKNELNWKKEVSVREGLEKTINWAKENINLFKK